MPWSQHSPLPSPPIQNSESHEIIAIKKELTHEHIKGIFLFFWDSVNITVKKKLWQFVQSKLCSQGICVYSKCS